MKNKSLKLLITLNCLLLAPAALANNLVVTTLADSGSGSLRQAISAISPTGGTITFAPGLTGTITLTSGELQIGRSMKIVGPGASVLVVNNDHVSSYSRVFNILTNTPALSVTISGLTISGGLVYFFDGDPNPGAGGGIFNSGNLVLNQCVISGNQTGFQQGITTDGLGGGIYSAGTLEMTNCTVNNNSTGGSTHIDSPEPSHGGNGYGGGIYLVAGSVVNCTIAGNTASGGGWPNGFHASGIGGNAAGGGIWVGGIGVVNLISCTISSNAAVGGPSGPSPGGSGFGGGIDCANAPMLENTIVSGNSVGAGSGQTPGTATGPDVNGNVNSGGFNLIGNADGSSGWIPIGTSGADLTGTGNAPLDPLLGPLQNNGGPTPTMALMAGSAAIDAGAYFGPPNDQHGYSRPYEIGRASCRERVAIS